MQFGLWSKKEAKDRRAQRFVAEMDLPGSRLQARWHRTDPELIATAERSGLHWPSPSIIDEFKMEDQGHLFAGTAQAQLGMMNSGLDRLRKHTLCPFKLSRVCRRRYLRGRCRRYEERGRDRSRDLGLFGQGWIIRDGDPLDATNVGIRVGGSLGEGCNLHGG